MKRTEPDPKVKTNESIPVSSETELRRKEGEQILEQQVSTLPTTFVTEVTEGSLSSFFTEFHVTVQHKVENLTRKQASMLLMILNFEAVGTGVDFTGYLAMEHLFTRLVKSGHEIFETREIKTRETLYLTELILTVLRGSWLSFTDRERLPEEVIQEIFSTGWLPDERVINSWKPHWNVRKYLQVRAVRLDSFNSEERSTQRYDSYTKGYGNGGHLSRVKRTPFSQELDRDDTEERPIEFNLLELEQYNSVLLAIEKWKATKKAEK